MIPVENKVPRWGIGEVLGGVLVLFFIQVLAGLTIQWAISYEYQMSYDKSDILLDELQTEYFSSPAILFSLQMFIYISTLIYLKGLSIKKGVGSIIKEFHIKFKAVDVLYGLIIGWGMLLFTGLILTGLTSLFGDEVVNGATNAQELRNQTGVWFFLLTIGIAGLTGPIMEEIIFRGWALQGIKRSVENPRTNKMTDFFTAYLGFIYSHWVKFRMMLIPHADKIAILISSIVFGFAHFQGGYLPGHWVVVVATGVLGAVLAVVTLRTKRLGAAIIAHIVYNSTTLIVSTLS